MVPFLVRERTAANGRARMRSCRFGLPISLAALIVGFTAVSALASGVPSDRCTLKVAAQVQVLGVGTSCRAEKTTTIGRACAVAAGPQWQRVNVRLSRLAS